MIRHCPTYRTFGRSPRIGKAAGIDDQPHCGTSQPACISSAFVLAFTAGLCQWAAVTTCVARSITGHSRAVLIAHHLFKAANLVISMGGAWDGCPNGEWSTLAG